MSSRRKRPGESTVLPTGTLPCVWMTAGLVAYKLCDRELDCDNCPFDAALRGVDLEPQATPRPERKRRWDFRDDRRYHASHGWIQAREPGRARYGLDAFASRLLGRPIVVVLPAVRSRVRKNETACWVMDDVEPIPLISPVTGTVVGVNSEVQDSPGLVYESPYDAGWLMDLRCDRRALAGRGLMDADEIRARAAEQLRGMREEIAAGLESDASLGTTLADGGRRLTDLRRILGPRRYHRWVVRLLR